MHHSVPGAPGSVSIAKAQAKRLREALNSSTFLQGDIVHGQALELIAKTHGYESWGHLNAALSGLENPQVDVLQAFEGRSELISPRAVMNLILDASNIPENGMFTEILYRRVSFAAKKLEQDALESGRPTTRGLPFLLEFSQMEKFEKLVNVVEEDARDPSSQIPKAVRSGIERLHRYAILPPSPSTFRGALLASDDLLGALPVETSFPGSAHTESIVDGKHALLVAKNHAKALALARDIGPFLDLTYPGSDMEVLLREASLSWGIPPLTGLALPEDALTCAVAASVSAALQRHPDQAPLGRHPKLIVLLKASDVERGGRVLLAQARSMGLHLLVWIDVESKSEALMKHLLPNVGRAIFEPRPGIGAVMRLRA